VRQVGDFGRVVGVGGWLVVAGGGWLGWLMVAGVAAVAGGSFLAGGEEWGAWRGFRTCGGRGWRALVGGRLVRGKAWGAWWRVGFIG
jgi:hypothetical protein